jgi:acetyl-CoA acetyltransferase
MGDREVVILGVGLHPFVKESGKIYEELGRTAINTALKESGVPFKDIEAAYVGHITGPPGTGLRVVGEFGMTGIPIVNMEVACTSATQAVVRAAYEIATGLYDVVLAVGVDKLGRGLLSGGADPGSWDEVMGLRVMPAAYALSTRKHMEKYGTTFDQICKISVKEHKNGSLAPHALYQKEMTLDEVKAGRVIAFPINLFMCSPNCDGATAAVLCAKSKAKKYTSATPITIAGWSLGSPKYVPPDEEEESGLTQMAKEAFERAGIGPEDVGVMQVHNAFSPAEITIPESLGFIPEGEGGRWIDEGRTEITGELPINTDGGLVSCGHPVGATGIRQITELVWQLRGEAGKRQVKGPPKVGFQQNSGVGGNAITILKR